MINYDLLNLVSINNGLCNKKINFKAKLKKINNNFLKNVKIIDKVKSLNYGITESSNWVMDNLLLLKNESINLLNDMFINTKKFFCIKFDDEFLPRPYLFCVCVVEGQNTVFEERSFFEKLEKYENNVKLNLKEIWSVPFFLKYAVLEKIYKIIDDVAKIEEEKFKVNLLFNEILKFINEKKFKNALKKVEKFFNNNFSLYALEFFIDLLNENKIKEISLNDFIDKILENEKISYKDLKDLNSKNLNEKRIKISMFIQSLKSIALFDFKFGLENVSSVHKEFLKDPSGVYSKMDYESRMFYLDTFRKICEKNNLNEYMECIKILNLCTSGENNYSRHIGYYLIDEGSYRFKNIKFLNLFKRGFYLFSIFGGILSLEILLLIYFKSLFDNNYLSFGVSILFLIILSDSWINLVNHLFLKNIDRKFYPKMDYSKKIPDEAKTIVVIPSLLSSKEEIDELFKNLELSYISNKGKNIYFSILFDYMDTLSYDGFDDKILFDYAEKSLKDLNIKYSYLGETKFYMFVRDKVYNESNKIYMGWERKRGKIMEFINFLKGRDSSFKKDISDFPFLKDIKYIITIDSDTKLMKDSAYKLIGVISHVLNKAVIKNVKKRNKVIRGYGIAQPKVNINFESSLSTVYSKLFVGNVTTSSYNSISSNIYNDIFSDGIFIGKGIIDIDVFDKILWGAIPENRILSHDLIEGCFSRVLFSSDIEVEENFPSNILSSFLRLHRWIRGDWQLIFYIFKGRGLSWFSKYKILDNLRRSLVPLSCALSLFLIFLFPIKNRNIYYGLILINLLMPIILDLSSYNIESLYMKNATLNFKNFKEKFTRIYVMFSFLPYHAYIILNAVIKVFIRLLFTKKNLLEWKSFQEIEKNSFESFCVYFFKMISCVIVGFVLIFMSFYFKIYEMILPSFLFILSPFIAYSISKKHKIKKIRVTPEQDIFLRSLSRSTFSYFEDFVTESTNYLICDNYQETPSIGIVKKTSPTNIGMSLNAFVLGRDFGFITILNMVDMLKNIMNSIDSLPVYRGHLYNWYDIENLVPIGDRYISTVDSGNLLSSYYLCKKSLEDILNKPIIHGDLIKSFEEMSFLSNKSGYDHFYKDVIKKGYECNTYIGYIKFLEEILDKSRENISEIKDGDGNEDVYWHIKINESSNNFLNEILNITSRINEIPSFKIEDFGKIFIITNLGELEKELIEFKKTYNNSSVRNELVDLRVCEIINNVRVIVQDIKFLIDKLNSKINMMDFKFLYNKERNLLSIGYDCEGDLLNENCYDLLASESRIASFLSIAKGDVPIKHWFALGRFGTNINGNKVLMSWGGTMFEYLMPFLYMRAYPETLLHSTYSGVVDAQIRFSNSKKIPFGISESCFYKFDCDMNYQYKAFGIPSVSIKKDHENLVVSPYSSIMSLMVDFKNSFKNLKNLKSIKCLSRYGFYEAIDFTKDRNLDNRYSIVKSYMAHHQGMSLMALSNVLMDNICQDRFKKIIEVQSISYLLDENLNNMFVSRTMENEIALNVIENGEEYVSRMVKHNKEVISDMQIYSNGNYSLGISSSGGGYLRFKDKYISPINYDFVEEKTYGNIYIKDIESGKFFSNTFLPCKNDEFNYTCEFNLDKVVFKTDNRELNVTSEIFISNDQNVEVRKIILKNLTSKVKNLELTSYFESEILNNKFDYVNEKVLSICSDEEESLFMGHSIYSSDNAIKDIKFESSRQGFIGINGTLQYPVSMGVNSNYGGNRVYDYKIMSLRCSLTLNSYEHVSVYFINALDESKDDLIKLIDKYKNLNILSSLFYSNLYNFKIMLNNLKISSQEISLFNYMIPKIIYGFQNKNEMIGSDVGIKDLISHNINSDIPIVSIEIENMKDIKNIEVLVKGLCYFTKIGLDFNLVILNSYLRCDKQVDGEINKILFKYNLNDRINVKNGIYIISSNIYKNTYEVIKSISNVFISSGEDIYSQLNFKMKNFKEFEKEDRINNLVIPSRNSIFKNIGNVSLNKYLFEFGGEISDYDDLNKYVLPRRVLKFYNSYGGFSKNYSEYVMKLNTFNVIPYIYKNVLGNKFISTTIFSSGFMSTWAFECKEFLITEDFTKKDYDIFGECVYIREKEFVWSPTFNPIDNGEDYIVSNSGFSTKITNQYRDVKTSFECFVPDGKKFKVIKMEIKNLNEEDRDFNIYYFAPIVLSSRDDYSRRLNTYINRDFDYIYAENSFSKNFRNLKSYLKIFGCFDISFTGSKKEFLGINNGYFNPSGVYKDNLSNLTGMSLDPCLCSSGKIRLKAFESKDIFIILGYDSNLEEINFEVNNFSNNLKLFDELYKVNKECFQERNKEFQIKTKDEHLDILFNEWSLNQSNNEKFFLSSSFNGELNSCVNLMDRCLVYTYLRPEESKKNIIRVFSNMYEDGNFKDKWSYLIKGYEINSNLYDLMWILYVLLDYIKVTGDFDILNIEIDYVNNNDLKTGFSNIYEKCLKIIYKGIYIDDMNIPKVSNKILDVNTLFMMYKVLNDFDEILLKINDIKNRDIFNKVKYNILDLIESKCFNGEFYINNLNDIKTKSFYNDIYLLPQIMALLCINNDYICDKVVSSIEKYLVNRESGFLRESFIKDKDCTYFKNNKNFQNNRLVMMFVNSLVRVNLNDKAYRYLSFLNPILRNLNRNSANVYRNEPYIIPSKIEFTENNLFKVVNEDFNYISSLYYRFVLDGVLGFKLSKDGFYIDPCVPSDWKQYVIEYINGNSFYKIIVRRGESKVFKINGEKCVEKFMKFQDEGEYVIDITI